MLLMFASLSPVYVGGASDDVATAVDLAIAAAAARATAHGFDWIEPSRLHKVVTSNNADKFQHLIHGTNWYAMGCRAVEACLPRSSVAMRVLPLQSESTMQRFRCCYRCRRHQCRCKANVATLAVAAFARNCRRPPLPPQL